MALVRQTHDCAGISRIAATMLLTGKGELYCQGFQQPCGIAVCWVELDL